MPAGDNTETGGPFVGISESEVEDVFGFPPEEWDLEMDQMVSDIKKVGEQKPFFDAVLPDLYTSHLNGGDIADAFASLVQEQIAFGRITAYLSRGTSDPVAGARIVATVARNTGDIDDVTQRAFIDLWEEHRWIADAIEVAVQREDGYQYWTGHAVDVQYQDVRPEMYVQWQAKQGIDDLWDIEAPMSEVLRMFAAVTRFQEERIEAFLDNRGGSLALEADDIEEIRENIEQLIQNAESLKETVPRLEKYTIETMDDYSDFDETLDSVSEETDPDDDLPDYTYSN